MRARHWKIIAFTGLFTAIPMLAVAGPTGKEIYQEVLESTPVYDDPELAAYIGKLVSMDKLASLLSGTPVTTWPCASSSCVQSSGKSKRMRIFILE